MYMHKKLGTHYHWIPELYRRMKLPVFDGIKEALRSYNTQRKRALEKIKTEKCKRRRVKLRERTEDAQRRKVWSLKHGQDTYGINEDDLHCNVDVAAKGR